ncbi:hypothetical protein KUH03_30975 [Sphingobacterium sp. E70]|uniref:hypothetical protein n=1 Tax=Sphingobacterium sp. E70 TaxID=2853439 RepID=UPI00211C4D84|nr:hypothetical protein [Sphingobacterium sp. E70]ULT23560.1 hypothetical protein KUH03_30975 [Sphingobacterium sp. E70]
MLCIQSLLDEVAEDFLKDYTEKLVLTEDPALKTFIENKFIRIEHELSGLLIEVGNPAKIRPTVDAIVEYCTSLIRYVGNQRSLEELSEVDVLREHEKVWSVPTMGMPPVYLFFRSARNTIMFLWPNWNVHRCMLIFSGI